MTALLSTRRRSYRLLWNAVTIVFCLPVLLVIFFARRPFDDGSEPPSVILVLPATHATPEFCRTLTTALLQGYSPVVLNWRRANSAAPGLSVGSRVVSIRTFLDRGVESDKDVVVVLEDLEAWIQQPPHVLLDRLAKIEQDSTAAAHDELGVIFVDALVPDEADDTGKESDYVGSQAILGRANHMTDLYMDLSARAGEDRSLSVSTMLREAFDGKWSDIRPDLDSRFFFRMHEGSDDVVLVDDSPASARACRGRLGQIIQDGMSGSIPIAALQDSDHAASRWNKTCWGRLTFDELYTIMTGSTVINGVSGMEMLWADMCGDVIEQSWSVS